jgi:hypothetical protein
MLATRKAEVSGHAPQPLRRSSRLPTGGGALVRFDFQKKWSLRLDSHQHLTAYETATLLYATERKKGADRQ